MAVNHRYLIGKEIEYNHEDYIGRSSRAIVAHIDKDIGITIVEKDDKKRNLICLNGPSTIYYKTRDIKYKNYKKCFDIIVEQIVSGTFLYNSFNDAEYYGRPHINSRSKMASCPYSGE
jgi:hypothetical protein